jgi:tRNA (guanine37-N1)-methyltransferase
MPLVGLIPGVLGNADSAGSDTFSDGLVEYAHYTAGRHSKIEAVPDVLFSGNHQAIDRWRRETALMRTVLKRPDLLKTGCFSSGAGNCWKNGAGKLAGSFD